MNKKKYKLIIFDADDTLRFCTVKGQPCPNKPEEWKLLPNVKAKLAEYDWASLQEGKVGYGIASNQGGVGMGYFKAEIAFQLLRDTFIAAFGYEPKNEVIQMCTTKPHVDSINRKPRPGMLNSLMAFWRVTPEDTLFVGDMQSDKETALNADCDFMWAREFFGF